MIREQIFSDAKVSAPLPLRGSELAPTLWHQWLEAWHLKELPQARMPSRGGVEREIDGLVYRFCRAETEEQLEMAGTLVMRRYAWRGYDAEGALSSSAETGEVTYIAHSDDRVDGTLTVRIDGQAELLAEQLYPEEIAELRRKHERLCEFGRLAFDEGINTLELLGPLFHLGMHLAQSRHGCSAMVIEVNPRHVGFYRRVFGFTVLGEERTCDRVAAPAVLLYLPFDRASRRADEEGGTRTGRKSIYPYCLGGGELAAVRRSVPAAVKERGNPSRAPAVC